jgi:hypothetical protein
MPDRSREICAQSLSVIAGRSSGVGEVRRRPRYGQNRGNAGRAELAAGIAPELAHGAAGVEQLHASASNVTATALRRELGDSVFETLPAGALGLYTYYERLAQGLRQLMAGSRKFAVDYISRNDLAALTRESAEISGIQHVMDVDGAEVEEILGRV